MAFAGISLLALFALWTALFELVHTAETPLFQATSSVASDIATLQSAAKNTIQQNSSHDFSAAFLTSIHGKTFASIYTNWPVLFPPPSI
jgi:hypothetical protein